VNEPSLDGPNGNGFYFETLAKVGIDMTEALE